MMEVCEDSRFFFGQADLLLAYLDTKHTSTYVKCRESQRTAHASARLSSH